MDVALVKSEISADSRRIIGVGGGQLDGNSGSNKCIKRRRRAPAVVPININGNGELPAEQSPTSSTIKRSSRFRGVSSLVAVDLFTKLPWHRWTGRFEAHLWDKGSWNVTQRKKGKQVYLGAYDEEESAARAYDLAALKYWGPTTFTNFPVTEYEKEIQIMQTVTKEEYLASLRRKSSGFSRGISKYRGVARHHHNGRWEARIGRVFGNKYLYLGTYSTQEEAAHAYDIAAIEYRGINAVTNFDLSTYIRWLRPGTFNPLNPPQGPQTSNDQPQTLRPTTNLFMSNQNETILSKKAFNVDELVLPCKQEFIRNQISSSKSSPTALGLLLKSPMFQQLVEKNVNAPQDDIDRDHETQYRYQQQEDDDAYHGILYEEIADGQFNVGHKPSPEVQESTSFYERNEQGFWNGVLRIQ